jgi:hypothetical protein
VIIITDKTIVLLRIEGLSNPRRPNHDLRLITNLRLDGSFLQMYIQSGWKFLSQIVAIRRRISTRINPLNAILIIGSESEPSVGPFHPELRINCAKIYTTSKGSESKIRVRISAKNELCFIV